MFNSVSARQMQRDYTSILKEANSTNKPVILMSNNQPQGAIIGLELLERIQLDWALNVALNEHKKGNTARIASKKDLEKEIEEIQKIASGT